MVCTATLTTENIFVTHCVLNSKCGSYRFVCVPFHFSLYIWIYRPLQHLQHTLHQTAESDPVCGSNTKI